MGIEPTRLCLQGSAVPQYPAHGARPRILLVAPFRAWRTPYASGHGGDEGDRTLGLAVANGALFQLSYVPRSAQVCRTAPQSVDPLVGLLPDVLLSVSHRSFLGLRLVRKEGVDPSTSGVSSQRSTGELLPREEFVELNGIEPSAS
jgi:hypothetical protein